MASIQKNRCYSCNKLFCCSDCCNEHIEKKHPKLQEVDCSLCRSNRLLVKNFDDPEYLCHVVFNHLPLCCLLCGLLLKHCDDLQRLGACNRFVDRVEEDGKSVKSPDSPYTLNKTPFEGDYNGNFRNLTSPPELSRNTSTPMQINVAGLKANFVFKVPKSPNISIKTPKTSNQSSKIHHQNDRTENINTENISSSNDTNFKDAEEDVSSSCDTNYMSFLASSGFSDRTPLRSILMNRSANDASSYLKRSNNTGRKLDSMEELDEEVKIEEVVEMEMTKDARDIAISTEHSNINANEISRDNRKDRRGEVVKKVRFSDKFEIQNDNDTTENEEFFEARQSMSEMSLAVIEDPPTSCVLVENENLDNVETENKEKEDASSKDSKNLEKNQKSNDGSSPLTSRVIMMVVVEKNGSFDAAELAPLIDSGLKKLEVVTGAENSKSPPRDKENLNLESRTPPNSAVSFSSRRETTNSSGSGITSGGIFATMAHVMRMAFRSFPGARSLRNLSREPIGGARGNLSLLSSTTESRVTSTSVLTSLTSSITSRSAKRSRDTDENSAQSSDSSDSVNDVRSPLPKRPRGWYKIRAREPIARMRNDQATSPRGVSMETQCFQQGSLSIGNTIIPIPSRAHQSTQTD